MAGRWQRAGRWWKRSEREAGERPGGTACEAVSKINLWHKTLSRLKNFRRPERRKPPSGAGRLRGGSCPCPFSAVPGGCGTRSEEHTSELQSRENLVCRLLLEKKNE